jgi:hypothetical protein
VPEAILDPSPFIFLNAILVFGFTLSFCYDLEKEDRYQDLFLGIGTLLGFLGSCGMAIQWGTLQPLKSGIPGMIAGSWILSIVTHRVLPITSNRDELGLDLGLSRSRRAA